MFTKEDLEIWFEFKILNPFRDWIYPGYMWRNLFYYRTNIIKLHNLNSFEYTDVCFRMFEANMELIVDFIEKENPEKYTNWYDEDYGAKFDSPMFPEYKDMFVMDLIKKIYNYFKVDRVNLEEEYMYLCKFWSDNFFCFTECEDKPEFYTIDEHEHTIEDLEKLNPDWDLILKYISKEDIVKPQKFHSVISKVREKLDADEQHYLHLCIELRKYLVA